MAVFLFFQRENLVGPAEPWGWILAPLSVLMAGLLQFLIAYTVALLSFWVLDVSTFIFIQFAFEFLASGHLFPLDILPDGLHRLLLWSPYPYLLYFPVGVYLGRIQGADLWQGFALQSAWVAAAWTGSGEGSASKSGRSKDSGQGGWRGGWRAGQRQCRCEEVRYKHQPSQQGWWA